LHDSNRAALVNFLRTLYAFFTRAARTVAETDMQTVTSFRASAVEPELINAIAAEYLALERTRTYRRLFVTRFGLLAFTLAIVGFGLHWLPTAGAWAAVGLCSVAPAWAWVAELRHDRRLARSLELTAGPGVSSRRGRKKVIKSS